MGGEGTGGLKLEGPSLLGTHISVGQWFKKQNAQPQLRGCIVTGLPGCDKLRYLGR